MIFVNSVNRLYRRNVISDNTAQYSTVKSFNDQSLSQRITLTVHRTICHWTK